MSRRPRVPAVTVSRNTLLRRPVAGSAPLTNPFTVALLTRRLWSARKISAMTASALCASAFRYIDLRSPAGRGICVSLSSDLM